MKKYKLLCSERIIGIICLIACIVTLLFEFWGELTQSNKLFYCVFRFCAQVSYSIIASAIFYFFTVYIRWIRKKALFKSAIKNKRKSIQSAIERIWCLYLDRSSVVLNDITEEKIVECCEKIHFNDLCGIYGGINNEYSFLEYFGDQAIYILNVINQIYVRLAVYMDEEELAILQEISDCQFIRGLENDYRNKYFMGYYIKNPTFKSRKDQIIDFYRLGLKYEKFINVNTCIPKTKE